MALIKAADEAVPIAAQPLQVTTACCLAWDLMSLKAEAKQLHGRGTKVKGRYSVRAFASKRCVLYFCSVVFAFASYVQAQVNAVRCASCKLAKSVALWRGAFCFKQKCKRKYKV
jgi:hypothetical protein